MSTAAGVHEAICIEQAELRCDVVVIGSGAGGGSAAWQLARAGLKVICLEEGGHYQEQDFSSDTGVGFRQLYVDDGQRVMTGNLYIPCAGGKCLGGSTVINSGISFRTPFERFEQWDARYGLDFRWDDYEPYLEEAWSKLRVTPANPLVYGGNNAFFEASRQRLGWSGGPMPRNAPYCAGCGVCNTGCPSGAKLSVAKVFVPEAVEAGATFLTHARAERAITSGDRVIGVRASVLDPKSEQPVGSIEIHARAVILAAGAIQSPVFLQTSGLGNEHVGEHLHVHPGVGALGTTDQQIDGWRGVSQGWYSDQFLDDEMMLESFWVTPELYYMSFPFGIEGTDAMLDLKHMVALGGVIADRSEGTVRPGRQPGKARVHYDLIDEDKNRLVRLQRRVTELMLAGGAHEVRTAFFGIPPITSMAEARDLLDEHKIRPKQLGNVYSSHPQGSARMGADPRRSAVDCRGKLHGSAGLYLMDASIFPDVLGVNPQITIIALSLMLSEQLAAELS